MVVVVPPLLRVRSEVRSLMAEAAMLRARSESASVRGGGMLVYAETLEKKAQNLCDSYNMGDARYV